MTDESESGRPSARPKLYGVTIPVSSAGLIVAGRLQMADPAPAKLRGPPILQRIGLPLALAWLGGYVFLGVIHQIIRLPGWRPILSGAAVDDWHFLLVGVVPNNLEYAWIWGPIGLEARYWIAGLLGSVLYAWLILAVRVRTISWIGLVVLVLYVPASIAIQFATIYLLMFPGTLPAIGP